MNRSGLPALLVPLVVAATSGVLSAGCEADGTDGDLTDVAADATDADGVDAATDASDTEDSGDAPDPFDAVDADVPHADASDAAETDTGDASDTDAVDIDAADAVDAPDAAETTDSDAVDGGESDADTAEVDAADVEDAGDTTDVEEPPHCSEGATSGMVDFAVESLLAVAPISDNSVANVRVADLLNDGSMQLLMSMPFLQRILWLHSCADASDPTTCQQTLLPGDLTAPVRATTLDFDGDGDNDVLISDIGRVPPTDLVVGGVVLLRNNDGVLEREVLVAGLRRTPCAEAADLDGDGLLDVVVCEFGHTSGNTRVFWQEADGTFSADVLRDRSGTIHAWPVDVDGDEDLDVVACISQQFEEIVLFRNEGGRSLPAEVIFAAGDVRFGMSGCQMVDLDQDGHLDVVYTNGDTLDSEDLADVEPWEFHGVGWLRNDGTGAFEHARIGGHWSAYSAVVGDFDLDCDLDVVSAALQVPEQFPDERVQGVVFFENDGSQNFTRHDLFEQPSANITSAAVDFDRDGDVDVVLGTFDVARAANTERVILLRNRAGDGLGLGSARLDPDAPTLGGTGVLAGELHDHRLNGRGFVYEVRSPLWTDGSIKWRGVLLPADGRVGVDDAGRLVFPEGTVLVKSFGFPHAGRVAWIETRLLWLRSGRWEVRSFRWRADGTDAGRDRSGGLFAVAGHDAPWPMPAEAECANCHGSSTIVPIGTRLEQLGGIELGGVEQLERLEAAGLVELPPVGEWPAPLVRPSDVSAALEGRARSWLDGNCAHCHRQGGTATRGGLWLDATQTNVGALGICREPAAGGPEVPGTTHLIVPGDPARSTLLARLAHSDPLVRMPEIGTVVVDEAGVALVSDWIAAMTPAGCPP